MPKDSVSFGYARRHGAKILDPTQRYILINGEYHPEKRAFKPGDWVYIIGDHNYHGFRYGQKILLGCYDWREPNSYGRAFRSDSYVVREIDLSFNKP